MKERGEFTEQCDYQPILVELAPGAEIVLQVDDTDYQGDSRVLYKLGDSYGLLIFGWGSCSGCDALAACRNWGEVDDLIEQLRGDIHWESSAAGMLAYIEQRDWDLQWSGNAEETKDFINKAGRMLQEDK